MSHSESLSHGECNTQCNPLWVPTKTGFTVRIHKTQVHCGRVATKHRFTVAKWPENKGSLWPSGQKTRVHCGCPQNTGSLWPSGHKTQVHCDRVATKQVHCGRVTTKHRFTVAECPQNTGSLWPSVHKTQVHRDRVSTKHILQWECLQNKGVSVAANNTQSSVWVPTQLPSTNSL